MSMKEAYDGPTWSCHETIVPELKADLMEVRDYLVYINNSSLYPTDEKRDKLIKRIGEWIVYGERG